MSRKRSRMEGLTWIIGPDALTRATVCLFAFWSTSCLVYFVVCTVPATHSASCQRTSRPYRPVRVACRRVPVAHGACFGRALPQQSLIAAAQRKPVLTLPSPSNVNKAFKSACQRKNTSTLFCSFAVHAIYKAFSGNYAVFVRAVAPPRKAASPQTVKPHALTSGACVFR